MAGNLPDGITQADIDRYYDDGLTETHLLPDECDRCMGSSVVISGEDGELVPCPDCGGTGER